jgi:type II secretory pathway pseudopilin PulG
LVELLISLAITALLLTAVSLAVAASARIVRETDDFSHAAQTARFTLNLILSDCRRGQPDPTSISSTQLRVFTAENIDRTYRYNSATQQITLINNDILNDVEHVVARNVSSATFSAQSDGTPLATRRVTLELTVTVGKNAIHLCGSTAPRQNVTY